MSTARRRSRDGTGPLWLRRVLYTVSGVRCATSSASATSASSRAAPSTSRRRSSRAPRRIGRHDWAHPLPHRPPGLGCRCLFALAVAGVFSPIDSQIRQQDRQLRAPGRVWYGRGCTAAGAAVGAPFGALPLLPSAPILGALFLFRASSRLQLPIVAAPASCRRTACACNGPRSSHAAAAPHVASPHVASLHVASRTLHRRSALRSIIIGGRGQLRRGE